MMASSNDVQQLVAENKQDIGIKESSNDSNKIVDILCIVAIVLKVGPAVI